MQVSVENTSSLGRRLTVLVPAEKIQTVIQEKMSELSLKAHVSGFRAGNIPKKILEQKFGAQVRQEVVGKMIENSLPSALEQEKLIPAGRPVVEQISNESNSDLRYVVNFEIFPEFTLADFSQIKAEKLQVEITEKDIDTTIEKLKNQLSDWVNVEREIKEGDRVVVDYTSTINGKPYENNAGKDIQVEIGSRLFIEGFEQGLIQAKVGEQKTLELFFPADWRIEKLAGKPVVFLVSVKAIAEKRPAKIDETFAKKVGAASTDLEVIRQQIRENLEKQSKEIIESRLKDQVGDALLKDNPIPLPQSLVEREMTALHEDLHRRTGDAPKSACQHHGLLEQAQRRVGLGLILNEVIKNEKLEPDPAEVQARVAAIAKMFGNAEFLEDMYHKSEELLAGVRHTVLLDQALDFVISKISITPKKVSIDTLFNREKS